MLNCFAICCKTRRTTMCHSSRSEQWMQPSVPLSKTCYKHTAATCEILPFGQNDIAVRSLSYAYNETHLMTYTTIITEGGLLPADTLDAIANEELTGQRPEDFGLERGRNLSDRIAAAWQAARGHWMLFKTYVEDLREGDPATSVTRQRWVLPLLDVLGYQPAFNAGAYTVEGRSYAISHRAGQ